MAYQLIWMTGFHAGIFREFSENTAIFSNNEADHYRHALPLLLDLLK
jgi:hypothetical protein